MANTSDNGLRLPTCFFLTDDIRTPDPAAIVSVLPSGTGVILRHYQHPERVKIGRQIAAICNARGLLFLVAEDEKLAHRLAADGLHLPERRLAGAGLVPLNRRWIVTAAVHTRSSLARAANIGVDAALVSPVFSTASHPGTSGLGVHRLARMTSGINLPVYALGGINARNIRKLPPGIQGVAAIGLFAGSETGA